MRFSERMGFKPVKSIIQIDSMDVELRNGLWNALHISYWNAIPHDTLYKYLEQYSLYTMDERKYSYTKLFFSLYIDFFKKSLDELPKNCKYKQYSKTCIYDEVKQYFLIVNGMKFMILLSSFQINLGRHHTLEIRTIILRSIAMPYWSVSYRHTVL